MCIKIQISWNPFILGDVWTRQSLGWFSDFQSWPLRKVRHKTFYHIKVGYVNTGHWTVSYAVPWTSPQWPNPSDLLSTKSTESSPFSQGKQLSSWSKCWTPVPASLRASKGCTQSHNSLAAQWWNELPADVRTAESLTSLCKRLKTHLLRAHLGPHISTVLNTQMCA